MTKKVNIADSLKKDFISKLKNKLIISSNNEIILFNNYFINKNGDSYIVYRKSDDSKRTFNSIKHATAWAILDKYYYFSESIRIWQLDHLIVSCEFEIELNKSMCIKSKDRKEIFYNKLSYVIEKQKNFMNEIDKYITVAKICQEKGFQNELTRISRS